MSANYSYTNVLHPSKVIHRDKYSELIYIDSDILFVTNPSFVVIDRMAVNGRLGSIKEFVQDYCLKAVTNGKLLIVTSEDPDEMLMTLAEQALIPLEFTSGEEYIMYLNNDPSEEYTKQLDINGIFWQGYIPTTSWLESYHSYPDPGVLLMHKADKRYGYIDLLHKDPKFNKLRFKSLNKTIPKAIMPYSVVDKVGESHFRINEKWRIPLFYGHELYPLDELTRSLLFNGKRRSRQIGILEFFGQRFCALSIESIDYELNRTAVAEFSNVKLLNLLT